MMEKDTRFLHNPPEGSMKLFSWYRQQFVAPGLYAEALSALEAIMPELRTLSQNLSKLSFEYSDSRAHPADKIGYIVDFFNLISSWHDRGEEIGRIAQMFEGLSYAASESIRTDLDILLVHFSNAGRNPYGYNRTEPGELVTATKVFLGDRCGLWTNSVEHWKSLRDDTEEVARSNSGSPMTACDVVWSQARRFMDSHVYPVMNHIASLDVSFSHKMAA